PLYLFYANRDVAGMAFLKELREWSDTCPKATFVPALTGPDDSWTGERGRIDASMLNRYVAPVRCRFLVSGPAGMVEETKALLFSLGVPAAKISAEVFDGY